MTEDQSCPLCGEKIYWEPYIKRQWLHYGVEYTCSLVGVEKFSLEHLKSQIARIKQEAYEDGRMTITESEQVLKKLLIDNQSIQFVKDLEKVRQEAKQEFWNEMNSCTTIEQIELTKKKHGVE